MDHKVLKVIKVIKVKKVHKVPKVRKAYKVSKVTKVVMDHKVIKVLKVIKVTKVHKVILVIGQLLIMIMLFILNQMDRNGFVLFIIIIQLMLDLLHRIHLAQEYIKMQIDGLMQLIELIKHIHILVQMYMNLW